MPKSIGYKILYKLNAFDEIQGEVYLVSCQLDDQIGSFPEPRKFDICLQFLEFCTNLHIKQNPNSV